MAEKRNRSIQLLRVCACVMVFVVHFGQRVALTGTLRQFTDFGKYGVHIFFLISGFLAGKTFFDNPNVSISNYYKKRLIAILPLYYLVILYYFVSENILNQFISVIPSDELGIGWFRYIFLLNGFLNSDTYFWSNLGITWTIPIFMFFYLIAPWILRKARTPFLSGVVWIIVFITTRALCMFYDCSIFAYVHLLFLGAMLYAWVKEKWVSPAIIICCISAIAMTILGATEYVYISLLSCIMLAVVNINNISLPDWVQRIIDVLDAYSYSVYLIHGVVFCSLIDRLNMLSVPKWIIAALAIIGTFFATWIVGRFVEKPIQSFLKKRLLK